MAHCQADPYIIRTTTVPSNSNAAPSHQKLAGTIDKVINLKDCPIADTAFASRCKQALDEHGVLVLPGFLTAQAVASIVNEGVQHQSQAYYTSSDHNVYLKPVDAKFSAEHPRNRRVSSSKGCITTDQIPADSLLRVLYDNDEFKHFLCSVLDEPAMHQYADPLSSINLHYASEGQELGWHFDNSSFAITLLIQKPEDGGVFEYVRDVRDADAGDMNFETAGKILDGQVPVQSLEINPGALVLFRGRNSMHRVTPTMGDTTRMLVVLAYNAEPGVSLSESARMTFYGRLQ